MRKTGAAKGARQGLKHAAKDRVCCRKRVGRSWPTLSKMPRSHGDRGMDTSTQLHAVREARRRPVFELHAERQTAATQHVLDLGQRLLAEVRGLQQLNFGLLHQIADVV